MMKSRTPRVRVIVGALAVLLLSACDDATEPSPGKPQSALELELQGTQRDLERSRQALVAAEQRLLGLREEQIRDGHRIAALEQRNRELGQQLTRARRELAQSGNLQKVLRRQRDQNARQVRELSSQQQATRSRFASAQGEIRRLQTRQSPGQRQLTDLYHRGAVAARELEELRRYNGFLLQERSNLQAWLQEANATRRKQQDALHQSQQEADRIKSDSEAANQNLRVERDKANRALVALETSRNALTKETHRLRAAVARATEAERNRSDQLEKALAHASTLADAHDRMAAELQSNQSALARQQDQRSDANNDAKALRTELEQATSTIAKLRTAKRYLVEKVEACALQSQSSRAESLEQARHLALLGKLLRSRSEAASSQQDQDRLTPARWQPGAASGIPRQFRSIRVATQTDEQATGTRREKELDKARQKVKALEQEQAALTKKLLDLETECAAVQDQVQTLTWANEVLVKELDAAYAAHEAGIPGSLLKGNRGIYVMREGESLSRVAKAFYGDT